MWTMLANIAWVVSFAIIAYLVIDWLRTDKKYPEDVLTSSREGELEAETEAQHHQGGH